MKFTNHEVDSSGDEVCRWREITETREGFCTVSTTEFGETSTEHDIPIAIALGRVKDWDKADEKEEVDEKEEAWDDYCGNALAYINRFVSFLRRHDDQI